MSVTSNIPRCAWIIVAIPTAILILSFSWLVLVYSCVIKSAKESTISTPLFTLTSKVESLDNNVQDILEKYNQLLAVNTQLIEQLNNIEKASTSSISAGTSKQNYNIPAVYPSLLENAKHQSVLLLEQKQKLQGVSTDLQNFKTQFRKLEKDLK